MNLGPYGKTLTALFTWTATWLMLVATAPGGFDHISASDWITGATGLAAAIGVFGTPGAWLKGNGKWVTALTAGVIGWAWLVVQSPAGPPTTVEWITGLIAVGTALGVYQTSNAPSSTTFGP